MLVRACGFESHCDYQLMKTGKEEIKNDALAKRLETQFVGHTFELKSVYDSINFRVMLVLIIDNKETSIKINSELRDDIVISSCHPMFGTGKKYTQKVIDDVENEIFYLLSGAVEKNNLC